MAFKSNVTYGTKLFIDTNVLERNSRIRYLGTDVTATQTQPASVSMMRHVVPEAP
jgi:hypothetical protein